MIHKYTDVLIKAKITVPDASEPSFYPIMLRQDRLALALQEAQDDEREHIAAFIISQGHIDLGKGLLAAMHRPINWEKIREAEAAYYDRTI